MGPVVALEPVLAPIFGPCRHGRSPDGERSIMIVGVYVGEPALTEHLLVRRSEIGEELRARVLGLAGGGARPDQLGRDSTI